MTGRTEGRSGDLAGVTVSFDFDGVLARSPFGHGVLTPVLRTLGEAVSLRTGESPAEVERRALALSRAEFRARTSRGEYVLAYDWQSIVEGIARELGERFDASLAEMTEEYAAAIERDGDRSMAYPRAVETLKSLNGRGARLLLLTNGYRCYQLPIVRALGLGEYLDAVHAADDLGAVKPFPEAFERAFAAFARPPAGRYHVGDTLVHDVYGARLSGIRSIWIYRDLPEGLARLDPLERARSPRLLELLRTKLDREEVLHGVAGMERPPVEEVVPDAVVTTLEEVEGAIDRIAAL